MAENTLGQWLYRRYGMQGLFPLTWLEISKDYQDYWEHEAQAVTRAVARGGFNREPEDQGEGLHEKFFVKKIHDPDGKHDACRYFVLDPLHDIAAHSALGWYALRTKAEGNDGLAEDLMTWYKVLGGGDLTV